MPPRTRPSPPPERRDGSDPLLDLSRKLMGEQPADAATGAAAAGRAGGLDADAAAEVELPLAELIRDRAGEVVVYNDSGFRTLALVTEARVVDSGRCGAHVTAAGEDVSGFNFVAFDNGTRVYYPEGLDLVTRRRPG